VAQERKKENRSKNGRFRYELLRESNLKWNCLLGVVAFIYPFLPKAGRSIPPAIKRTQHKIYVQF